MSSRPFEVHANYDEPRWQAIRIADYTDIDPALNPDHFPVREAGQRQVLMEYVQPKRVITVQEMLEDITQRGLALPNRPEAESALDQNPDAHYLYPVIGLCGLIVDRDGHLCICYVYGSENRRGIGFRKLSSWCYDYSRFLAVHRQG